MTRYTIKTALAFCLLLIFIGISSATELVDIRTGTHRKFSRVVMEFNRHVQYQVTKTDDSNMIAVTARPVETMAAIGDVEVDSTDAKIRSVVKTLTRQGLFVEIALHSGDVHLREYTMNNPFRLVIDVYPSSQPIKQKPKPAPFVPVVKKTAVQEREKKPAPKPVVNEETPEALAEAVVEDSAKGGIALFTEPEQRNALAARFDSLSRDVEEKLDEIFKLPENTGTGANTYTATEDAQMVAATAAAGKSDTSTMDLSFTILAILGFLLIDIVLITYYLASRKSKARAVKASPKPKTTVKKAVKPAPEIQPKVIAETPPEPVKQTSVPEDFEDPGSDFIAALSSMLDPNSGEIELPTVESDKELDEIRGIKQAVKVDSMIASLSEAITKPAADVQYIPELEDVLNDLEMVSSSPGALRDVSRNELLGRDGEEFLNNIRRDNLF